MSRKLAVLTAVLLLASMVGCDHATKAMARAHLAEGAIVPIAGSVLELRYTENPDVGFSALRFIPYDVRRPLVIGIGAVMILVLGFMALRREAAWPERLALAMLIAGAIGNNADRLFRGVVVDFIHLTHWPIFNVADICIVVGAALLVLTRLREDRRRPAEN